MNKLKGFRRYWNRKGYERLDGSGFRPKKKNRVKLATDQSGQKTKKRWFWRIKISKKLKVLFKKRRIISPNKILKNLRDSYVNLMIKFGNSSVFSTGYGGPGVEYPAVSYGYGFGKPGLKEYDEKVIVEVYKNLMEQGHLMPRDAAKIVNDGRLILCRRPLL